MGEINLGDSLKKALVSVLKEMHPRRLGSVVKVTMSCVDIEDY